MRLVFLVSVLGSGDDEVLPLGPTQAKGWVNGEPSRKDHVFQLQDGTGDPCLCTIDMHLYGDCDQQVNLGNVKWGGVFIRQCYTQRFPLRDEPARDGVGVRGGLSFHSAIPSIILVSCTSRRSLERYLRILTDIKDMEHQGRR